MIISLLLFIGQADKPHSVPLYKGGNHLSRMAVTRHLMQPTRCFLRSGQPQCICVVLLLMGFA